MDRLSDRVGGALRGGHARVLPPPPEDLRFRRKISLFDSLRDAWASRELVLTLGERELRARYKQAYLGFAWALIIPTLLMVVFTLFVKRLAHIETPGIPYPLFTYVALVPWTFFSVSMNQGGQALLVHSSLMNKVHCPREVFPLSSLLVAAVDALVATTILIILFLAYRFVPQASVVWVPLLIAIQLVFTLGAVLMVSAVTVYVRDIRHALPILLQLMLFATPVAYPVKLGPTLERIYAMVNPLAAVIDGYRRTILMGEAPELDVLGISAAMSIALFLVGFWVFKRLETGFADVS